MLASAVTGCVSISAFASLVGVPIGNTNCPVGLKICVMTAGIIKYMSTIEKKKKKKWSNSNVSKNYSHHPKLG